MFEQKIDMRSKKEMVNFLENHFRYDTMNSWNQSQSYAHNVKIYNVIPRELQDIAFELLEVENAFEEISMIIDEFGENHNYNYQVGFNGRSGGYLVLYKGKLEDTGYKSRCTNCGQLNFKTIEESKNNICGKCGEPTRKNLDHRITRVVTYPGQPICYDEDMDFNEIKSLTELIIEFDELCDEVVSCFIDLCKNYEVVEEEIYIPKMIKVMQEKTIV